MARLINRQRIQSNRLLHYEMQEGEMVHSISLSFVLKKEELKKEKLSFIMGDL